MQKNNRDNIVVTEKKNIEKWNEPYFAVWRSATLSLYSDVLKNQPSIPDYMGIRRFVRRFRKSRFRKLSSVHPWTSHLSVSEWKLYAVPSCTLGRFRILYSGGHPAIRPQVPCLEPSVFPTSLGIYRDIPVSQRPKIIKTKRYILFL